MKFQKPEFHQTGAVVRLKFSNFMQYRDTEFDLGPNLNVIIGPNGAGKSTIVNGICVGLAGKLSVLGRATTLSDFVLVGEDKAMVEIELFNKHSRNYVIQREFNTQGKSVWRIDGKKTTEKEVKELASKLRIQVDNLCQFLPQDKVHDFSRLNNKGLLDSTIDAVGNTGLKEKHAELKELQTALIEGENVQERKEQILQEKTVVRDRMEEEVKAFEEKRQLLVKIEMLSKKRTWSVFEDSRRICSKAKKLHGESKQLVDEKEGRLEPLKAELDTLKKKLDKVDKLQFNEIAAIKECSGKAKVQSRQIEGFEREMDGLQDQAFAVTRREKEKVANIEKCQQSIGIEERAIADLGVDDNLQQKLDQAKRNNQDVAAKQENEKQKKNELRYELGSKSGEKERLTNEMRQLESVDHRKLESLRNKSPQAYEAVKWLRNNGDNFKGRFFEPFIVCGNVLNPENAIYLENSIHPRDLNAFFFEDVDDMNNFMNMMRTEKRLEKVGAALIQDIDPDTFKSRVPAAQLANLGFVSYLKDMVQAPGPVLAYMCQQYNLHNTPVFKPTAEKHNDVIVNKFGMTKYYFGSKQQIVSRSGYSGKTSTRTSEVRPHGTLGAGVDQERMDFLTRELEQNQAESRDLEARIKSIDLDLQQLSVELEGRRKDQRDLEQTKNLLARHKNAIQNKQRQLRELSNEDFEADKVALQENRAKVIGKLVRAAELLQKAVEATCKAQIQKDLKALQAIPLRKDLDLKTKAIASLREEMKDIRDVLASHERELELCQTKMLSFLKEAKAATGFCKTSRNSPPPDVIEYFKENEFPENIDEIDLLAGQLEAQASFSDNVQEGVLEEYRRIKEQVKELEQDVHRRSKVKQNQAKRIERVKEEWLGALNDLIGEINERFAKFFGTMGFAGAVELHTGNHLNDFDNYGIKILVKYRDSEPLQELTPHHQSGGERSVATAIYMLALQALTTVPFRCVDEINQGMDARNERLVFELLVETSCEESNAQYFLLTPKLLPGLEYNPRMNVLIVHNGKEMLHHTQWDLDSICANLRED